MVWQPFNQSLQISPNFGLHSLNSLFECPLYRPGVAPSNIFSQVPQAGGSNSSEGDGNSPLTTYFTDDEPWRPADKPFVPFIPLDSETAPKPQLEVSLEYWAKQEASEWGVLGGYSDLSSADLAASRRFMRSLVPRLELSSRRPPPQDFSQRTRALESCAGMGRVTSGFLLNIVHDVVFAEPVDAQIQEGWERALSSADPEPWASWEEVEAWPGLYDGSRSVTFIKASMQSMDASNPLLNNNTFIGRLGFASDDEWALQDLESGFDVIWMQWCTCFLSDEQLIEYIKKSRDALRDRNSYMIFKENLFADTPDGGPGYGFKEEESCLARSDAAFKMVFKKAGVRIVKEKIDPIYEPPLMPVKYYAVQ